MPQPLSRVTPHTGFSMCNAGVRPLKHNPELGLLAMEAIISWSNVEEFLLNAYLEIFGGPSENAALAYLALENSSSKIAVLNAVARANLQDKYFDLLQAILKVAKTSQKNRDKLAHWTWGYARHIPDGFLLKDPRVRIEENAIEADRSLGTDGIYVFKRIDFEIIIETNDRICGYGLRFKYIIRGDPYNKQDSLYHELCAEPELAEKLAPHQV